jgi:hypothetical protein
MVLQSVSSLTRRENWSSLGVAFRYPMKPQQPVVLFPRVHCVYMCYYDDNNDYSNDDDNDDDDDDDDDDNNNIDVGTRLCSN